MKLSFKSGEPQFEQFGLLLVNSSRHISYIGSISGGFQQELFPCNCNWGFSKKGNCVSYINQNAFLHLRLVQIKGARFDSLLCGCLLSYKLQPSLKKQHLLTTNNMLYILARYSVSPPHFQATLPFLRPFCHPNPFTAFPAKALWASELLATNNINKDTITCRSSTKGARCH